MPKLEPTGSIQSAGSEVHSFDGQFSKHNEKNSSGDDHEAATISRIASRADADETDNVLNRLETLSKRLSSVTTRDTFTIDPSDFDLAAILNGFLHNAKKVDYLHRSTGVSLKDVTVVGVDQSAHFVPTVATALNIPAAIIEKFKNRGAKPTRNILKNINALVNAGEMCFVIGRPGAGCSTLLKTIAGEGLEQFKGRSGAIEFDGVPQEELLKYHKNDLVYNPELDVHFPHLTVKQTLNFAVGCRVPKARVNAVSHNSSIKDYVRFKTDVLATIFGLRHTYDTKVGNDFVRGVSGGERKRVSIAEALAAEAMVYCWDNATRGLDASTALEYASAIRVLTNLVEATNFVTIYQASQNIYDKFDKVLVLYEGRQIFFGVTTDAKQYFEGMGFECPQRQATPEFLTAVTDPKGRYPKPGYENKVPKNAEEFEKYWLNSPNYQKLVDQIAEAAANANSEETRQLFYNSSKQEKNKVKSTYTISYFNQLKLNFIRSYQIVIGDFSYLQTQIFADVVQGLIIGSLYWNIPNSTEGTFSRGAILFFACLYYSLAGLASVTTSFMKRPILLKQKGYSFYHPSTEFLASYIVDGLFKLIGITCFHIILFFLANLRRRPGNFFTLYLLIVWVCMSMNALFQMIALLSPASSIANSIAGLTILAIAMYCSFMIQLPSMHPWFKWISYLNPVRYAFEALLLSEFNNVKMACSNIVPRGPGYENVLALNQVCAATGSVKGQIFVTGKNYLKAAFTYTHGHLWRNFGLVNVFMVGFVSAAAIASEFIKTNAAGFDVLIYKKTEATKKYMDERNRARLSKDEEATAEESTIGETKEGEKEIQRNAVFEGLGSENIFMWQHVDYDIVMKDGTPRRLLNDVQGYVMPGTLTALMGESGAGKTTLLNTLSQRIDTGTITGDMLVNGRPLNSSFQRSTGYVQQQDLHVAELTVRESLRFAAQLRRARSIPDSEKFEYVENIIEILEMGAYADAVVGEPGYGLNVEQRKKLSIGVELVAKPNLLLFLDEPTSGLDSESAWSIVKLLRDLANAGQAILCTIHQPSAVLFEEFDRLLLLKKGGHTVYFGEIGKRSQTLLSYFERHGSRKSLNSENPAEYILEAIGAGATASVTTDWGELWRNSQEFANTTNEIQELIEKYSSKASTEQEVVSTGKFITPYWYQLKTVTARTGLQFFRDPTYIMAKLALMVLAGLFIGFTFWNAGHSLIGMQNGMFSVFLSIILSGPLVNQIQDRALSSRELFEVRESKSNTYHWSTLLLAQYFNELPYHLVFGTIFFVALYFPVHRNYDSFSIGTYYLFWVIVFQLYFISFGLFIIYMAPNAPSAAVVVSLCLSFMILFCGVVQPVNLMPGFWTFMWKVSPYTYFVQSFLSLTLHKLKVQCKQSELSFFDAPSGQTCGQYLARYIKDHGGYLTNPTASTDCGYCSYSVGDEYLASMRVSFGTLWRNFGLMWVYVIFNVAIMLGGYYILRVRTKPLFDFSKIIEKFKKT